MVVDDAFEFQDGTLHLSPGVSFAVAEAAHLKQGDQFEFRRPDGTKMISRLHSVDFLMPSRGRVGLCVNELTKMDVPAGTEVWKV